MPGKCKGRKHTPITTEAQRGLMGADYRRGKEGKKRRLKGMSMAELKAHLEESKGKKLPKRATKRQKTAEATRRIRKARGK